MEDNISALRECCPLKFSYVLDQALLVHTKMGIKTFERENLKFGLKGSAEAMGYGEGCLLPTGVSPPY